MRPLLQRELAPERLHAPRDAGQRAGGALNLGGGLHPLLRRVRQVAATLELLDSSVLPDDEMSPSEIVQFIEHADNGVLDAAELNAGAGRADGALAALDKTVGWVIEPLRALFDARRGIRQGGWDDADVQRAAALVRQVRALRGALDEAGPSEEQVGGLGGELKGIEADRKSAGRLARRIRETLGRLEATDLPAVVLDKALEELRQAVTSGIEAATASLERVRLLAALPWNRRAPERTDTAAVMRELDDAHEGRRQIKERIRRFLAVRALQQMAWTLEGNYGIDRVPDGDAFRSPEAGRIVKGLEEAGVRNPVFVLDEVDKLARRGSFGDPAAALLEVLDPQQNHAFHDCYADVPVDLSDVLFIATANRLESVPAPLRDRMEVIQVPAYTAEEKLPIVRKHLLPRQIEAGGLWAGPLWAGCPRRRAGSTRAPRPTRRRSR